WRESACGPAASRGPSPAVDTRATFLEPPPLPRRNGSVRLILFPACALLLAAAQAERPTTVLEPRAQALVADLPAPPAPPLPDGPPLSLAEALARARAASPDLAILRERVLQASLDVGRAWAQVKPSLNLTGSYTRNQDAPVLFVANPGGTPPVIPQEGSRNSVQGALVAQIPLFNGRVSRPIAPPHNQATVPGLPGPRHATGPCFRWPP